MTYRRLAVGLVALLTIAVPGSAVAKKKPAAPTEITYFLNWGGDCAGSGYLALAPASNDGACALFFPGLGDTYSFGGKEGMPFTLDASKTITLDFMLSQVVTAAADFQVVLEGTIGGKTKEIASGTQTVLVGTPAMAQAMHYDLEPDASLDKQKVTSLTLTVTWAGGVTYSQMDFANSTLVIGALGGPATPRSGSPSSAEPAPAPSTPKPPKGYKPTGSNGVVAVVDTGINPYHSTFRDISPEALMHPSTYIPGYPKNAKALRLTLTAPDFETALRADCNRVWQRVKPGQLYWVPGTKIIGAITFANPSGDPCSPNGTGSIIDGGGHGTMTGSRATSTEYGACKECKLVAVQFSASATETKDAIDSITWSADNAHWIDAQSNSWGPFVPAWEPTGSTLFTAGPPLVRAVEETAQKHLAFWASGNGAAFRGGAVGHPTMLSPHMTPSAIMVGGVDSGYLNLWPGFPAHIVSDACSSWGAQYTSIEDSGEKVGGGTSAATPFAAGGAVYELLRAREILGDTSTGVEKGIVASGPKGVVKTGPLADGKFTLEEWKRLVFVTATERPEAQYEDGPPCDAVDGTGLYTATPIPWSDVPPEYPEYVHIGYGAVDRPAMKLALQILLGKAEFPDRTDTDDFFAYDRQFRETTYEVFSKP